MNLIFSPFPDDFLWGARISAHQVEGGNFNADWWRWEQRPRRIRDGATSQTAANHYVRFREDFGLAAEFGFRALQFNVEWCRIVPEPGVISPEALDHYRNVLEELRARKIEPLCALTHVTTPRWFADRGGWRRRGAADDFVFFASAVCDALGGLCRYWIPLLEPVFTVRMGYVDECWPPGESNPFAARRCLRHMAEAHKRVYELFHEHHSEIEVGIGLRIRDFKPWDPNRAWDLRAARAAARESRLDFIDNLSASVDDYADFLGVAYYGEEAIRFSGLRPLHRFAQRVDDEGNAAGEPSHRRAPERFEQVLREAGSYGLPLMVTGNGLGTVNDVDRCRYLIDHVRCAREVLADGIDLRGYFFRSFMDGFEWTGGYGVRYGLFHVDRETLARTPNHSAFLYRELCETGTLRRGSTARVYG